MLPDDGDPSQRRRLERERAVVAQEDGRLGAGAAEKLEIRRAGGNRRDVRCRRDECADAVVGAQKATDGHVEVVLFDPSVVDGRDDGGPQRSTRSGHLEIEAGPQRKVRVGHCEPIGHDETLEAPFTSYEVEQELRSLGQPPPVQAVVGRHEPEGTALTDGDLKGQEIELSQRSLVDDRTDAAPFELRFVPDEVLHRREHACGLHAAHISGGQAPGEKRILRIALEIAPGERVTVQVHRRGQQTAAPAIESLSTDERAEPLGKSRIPRRSDGGPARDARRRRTAHARQGQTTRTVRAICHSDLRDAHPLDGNRGEHVVAGSQRGLLVKSQAVDQRVKVHYVNPQTEPSTTRRWSPTFNGTD